MEKKIVNEDLKDLVTKLKLLQRDIDKSLEHCNILEGRLNYIDIQINDYSKAIAKLNEQFSVLNAKIDFIEKWIEKEQEQKDKWSFKDRGEVYL